MKYSLSLRVMHWVMAVFILGMLCSGFYMTNLSNNNEIKFSIYAIHKACGITILGLVIIRLLFRIFTHIPPYPVNFSRLAIYASKVVHFCLYFIMLLMPISGYVMSSASGRDIKYIFHIPLLIKQNTYLANVANVMHSILAYFFILIITLHIFAVLKHIIIDRQNILKRIA